MVVEAIEELDKAKLDKPEIVAATIPATGWKSDGAAGYPYYYDLAVAGITAADIATVTLSPASVSAAVACGMCPTNETIAGAIRFRANEPPTRAVAVEYEIAKGKGNE